MSHKTRKPTSRPYEDLLHEFQFTRLSVMYQEAGNLQMANKVSLYEAALGAHLVAYRIDGPGCSVDLHFIDKVSVFPGKVVICDVGVCDLDTTVNAALSRLCVEHGVHESELRMKLELMGD